MVCLRLLLRVLPHLITLDHLMHVVRYVVLLHILLLLLLLLLQITHFRYRVFHFRFQLQILNCSVLLSGSICLDRHRGLVAPDLSFGIFPGALIIRVIPDYNRLWLTHHRENILIVLLLLFALVINLVFILLLSISLFPVSVFLFLLSLLLLLRSRLHLNAAPVQSNRLVLLDLG